MEFRETVTTTARLWTVACIAVSTAAGVSAHHSLSLFDTAAPVTIEGDVIRVDWRSPHTMIFVQGREASGDVSEWRVETVPNSWLVNRAGWTIDSVKPGERVKIELYAYSDKTIKYGFLLRVIKADGKVWASPLDIGRRGPRTQAQ